MGHGEVEDEIVERLRRHAGLHMLDEHVERLRRQQPGGAHALEILGSVQLDLPALARGGREMGIDEGHGTRRFPGRRRICSTR